MDAVIFMEFRGSVYYSEDRIIPHGFCEKCDLSRRISSSNGGTVFSCVVPSSHKNRAVCTQLDIVWRRVDE